MPANYSPTIFVVEGDSKLRDKIGVALSGLPWPVRHYDHISLLLSELQPATSGCVVASVAEMDHLSLLHRQLTNSDASLALVLLIHQINIDDAVSAIRAGVDDLILLPMIERDLRSRVNNMMSTFG